MPAWLIEIIGKSPALAGICAVTYFTYKVIDRALGSPESIATCFLLAGQERRKDALDFVRALQERHEQDLLSPLEGMPTPLPGRPRKPSRRHHRRRRRRR